MRVRVGGRGQVTDDDLIFAAGPVGKRPRLPEPAPPLEPFDPLRAEVRTGAPLDMAALFAAPQRPNREQRPRKSGPAPPADGPALLGRLVYAGSSLLHGVTEALGFVELHSFEQLLRSKGAVLLRKPNGTTFVRARLQVLFGR